MIYNTLILLALYMLVWLLHQGAQQADKEQIGDEPRDGRGDDPAADDTGILAPGYRLGPG